MYFRYSEDLTKNKNNKPVIFLSNENKPKNNSKEIATFDFGGFFDWLSPNMLEEMNKIFEYSNSLIPNQINKEKWIRFKSAYLITIPAVSERYSRMIKNETNKNSNVSAIYTEDKKERELVFYDTDDLLIPNTNLNLFEKQARKNNSTFRLTVHKEAIYNNEIQLLYLFLNCLFNSNVDYHIKKCEYCKKFYITTYSGTRYCSRKYLLNEEYVPCDKIIARLQQTRRYKKLMSTKNNLINSFETKPIYSDQYINDFKINFENTKLNYFQTRDITKLEDFVSNYKVNKPPY